MYIVIFHVNYVNSAFTEVQKWRFPFSIKHPIANFRPIREQLFSKVQKNIIREIASFYGEDSEITKENISLIDMDFIEPNKLTCLPE